MTVARLDIGRTGRAVVRRRIGGWQAALAGCAAVLVAVAVLVASAAAVSAAELVMFEERGCPWCVRFDREIAPAYPRTEEGRRAPLRRIDISQARRSGLRLAAPVTVTPTFVLVEDGAEVGRITGYPGADFFWGMLGEVLARLGPGARPAPPPAARPRDARAPGVGTARERDVGAPSLAWRLAHRLSYRFV